jgi:hypothetical protein
MGLETLMSNLGGLSGTDSEKEKVISYFNVMCEDEYYVAILDRGFESKLPFILNNKMKATAEEICNNAVDNRTKAKRLFDWTVNNIKYDYDKMKHVGSGKGYRNSVEVFESGEGVCGEMASFYVTMARTVGIKSSYVSVLRDFNGENVQHACAMINVPGKYDKFTLVDISYRSFDIAHKKFSPLSDFKVFQAYHRLNNG